MGAKGRREMDGAGRHDCRGRQSWHNGGLEACVALWRAVPGRHAKGLTETELTRVENTYGFAFPPELRACLAASMPIGAQFPNWRRGIVAFRDFAARRIERPLDEVMREPMEGVVYDVENNGYWFRGFGRKPRTARERRKRVEACWVSVPRLIPVYAHRYVVGTPCEAGMPVLSVWQTDVIVYGADFREYLKREFGTEGEREGRAGTARRVEFWSQFYE